MIFDLNPNLSWLFAMTHPDDELSICCWIKRLTENGNEVWMSWTHSTPEREREARSAADLLGVPQQRLQFYGAHDGSIVDAIQELLPSFKSQIDAIKPDRIVCGGFEQGHLDHDSTNFLVNRSFDGVTLEAPFYHTYANVIQTINRFADAEGEEIIELTPEEQGFKQALSKHYESQRIGDLLVWFEIWERIRFQPGGLWKSERLRVQTHKDFMKPNLPSDLADKVLRSARWGRWIRAMQAQNEPPNLPTIR